MENVGQLLEICLDGIKTLRKVSGLQGSWCCFSSLLPTFGITTFITTGEGGNAGNLIVFCNLASTPTSASQRCVQIRTWGGGGGPLTVSHLQNRLAGTPL